MSATINPAQLADLAASIAEVDTPFEGGRMTGAHLYIGTRQDGKVFAKLNMPTFVSRADDITAWITDGQIAEAIAWCGDHSIPVVDGRTAR